MSFAITKTVAREEIVFMRSGDSLGMNLGELRAAITAAEGMSDESDVRFEDLSTSIIEGEYFAKRIVIRERTKAE